jgi:hypothetical protein
LRGCAGNDNGAVTEAPALSHNLTGCELEDEPTRLIFKLTRYRNRG